ncbi:SMP-30/gluconolactonase/LRE family protein, partial [Mesorhizobium sp. M7A.F.Ca.ET.027.03.2.1]
MSVSARARHSGFDDVVGDATIETLASGFGFLEGPVWHPYEKWLVFSDIPESRMYRRSAEGEIELFRAPSHKANGNTLDRQGRRVTRLVACSQVTSRPWRSSV